MELRDVEAFVAVAEELHFGRAAKRLHVSQPPLSNRIRHFEQELGLRLFDRSTRAVRLTDAGERLLPVSRRVLMEAENVLKTARAISLGDEGQVRIGFAGASSQRSVPLLAAAVRSEFPGIELVLESQTYVFSALERVASGDLDLAFVRLPVLDPGLSHRVVEVEQLVCALPAAHPLADKEEIELVDLLHEGFVSLPDDRGSILQSTMVSLCTTAGFRPRIAQVAPDSATVLALVAAGAGVTITLSSVQRVQTVGIAYRPLRGVDPSHMFAALAWRTDNASNALARVLAVSRTALPTPDLSDYAIDRPAIGIGS
jgi:DNA-binding transcriptional LysR family regulator